MSIQRGEIYFVNLNPVQGREQAGRCDRIVPTYRKRRSHISREFVGWALPKKISKHLLVGKIGNAHQPRFLTPQPFVQSQKNLVLVAFYHRRYNPNHSYIRLFLPTCENWNTPTGADRILANALQDCSEYSVNYRTPTLSGSVWASQFTGSCLISSRLASKLLWSYTPSKGRSAGSQRQNP